MSHNSEKNLVSPADLERLRRFLRKGINITRKRNRLVATERIIFSPSECDLLVSQHGTGLWVRFCHVIDPTIPKVKSEDKLYKYVKKADIALNDVIKERKQRMDLEREQELRREKITDSILKKKLEAERQLLIAKKASKPVQNKPVVSHRSRSSHRDVLATPSMQPRKVANAYDMGSPETVRGKRASRNEIDDLF